MPNLTGQSIGRYHILEQLGEGGMAIVYKAYDTRLEREVAVKVLRTDQFIPAQLQMVLQRFEREAKSLAKLSHPNIVNILDYGEHEGMPYLVMEYMPGGTLKQKLGEALPWQEALQLLIPVAQGLAYAHQRGVIHRDVKPANILLKESGAPVLTDFGIAKLLEAGEGHTLTGSGVGIGTPEYMAPEQGLGAKTIDARADIYSLGIVLYEMVTGRKPYVADTPMAVVLKQMTDPLPRPTDFVPELPERVEYLLLKALAKQPDDRYADMNAMIAAMENLLAEVPTIPVTPAPQVDLQKDQAPAPMQTGKQATSRLKLSPKVLTAIGGILVIVLMVVFGLPWMQRQIPASSENSATPITALASVPTPTFTSLPPSATPEPSPSITPTSTLRPTTTPTSPPAWVRDFAGPILADIQSRGPDFQDDFERKSNFWAPADWCPNSMKIANGMMEITGCHIYWTRNYDNFVTSFDYRFPSNNGGQLRFYVRQSSSFSGCLFGFQSNGAVYWECKYPANFPANIIANSGTNHVLLIIRDNQFALYLNEKPITLLQIEVLKFGNSMLEGQVQVFVDNFKMWKIP